MAKVVEVLGESCNPDMSLQTLGATGEVAGEGVGAVAGAGGPARAETTGRSWSVVSFGTAGELEPYVASWELLAGDAAEPNLFYEHWMLLPALRLYGQGQDVEIALVIETDAGQGKRVVGVFPLQRTRRFRGLPVRGAVLWDHPNCFLCTPLIARGSEAACWEALFAWERASHHGDLLLELQTMSGDGPVFESFLEFASKERLPIHIGGLYTRPLLEVGNDADAYLRESMSKSLRYNNDRNRRRMSEMGAVETLELKQTDNLDAWVEPFFRLEASGWKSQNGTAIACHEADRQFFNEIAHEGFRRQRLKMVSLSLDGQAVATEFNMVAGEGMFRLKIAYDERHARFSPGMMLAVEIVRQLHEQTQIRWMDSCAAPGNQPMKRLWGQRRMIANVICPTGRRFSHLLVSLIPMGRYLQSWRSVRPTVGNADRV